MSARSGSAGASAPASRAARALAGSLLVTQLLAAPPGAATEPGSDVTGHVRDYFTREPIEAAAVRAALRTTSDAMGSYALPAVLESNPLVLEVGLDGYLTTRNEPVEAVGSSIEVDVFALSEADVQRQFATVGETPTAGRAYMVVADLRRPDGGPLTGVAAVDVVLLDELQAPVGSGPYFFGATGDIATTDVLPTSIDVDGRARVAFLDVPPGAHTLLVDHLDGGVPVRDETPVVAVAGSVSLLRSPPASDTAGSDGAQSEITGGVRDYFAKELLPGASVAVAESSRMPAATTDATGFYSIPGVPASDALVFEVLGEDYETTLNEPLAITQPSVDADLFALSEADVLRQFATVGEVATSGHARMVVADLRRADDSPLTGVPAADISLRDDLEQAVGSGPYFFGPSGDIATVDVIPASIDVGGRARAAFLDVPPGTHALTVHYFDEHSDPVTDAAPALAVADAVTLLRSRPVPEPSRGLALLAALLGLAVLELGGRRSIGSSPRVR